MKIFLQPNVAHLRYVSYMYTRWYIHVNINFHADKYLMSLTMCFENLAAIIEWGFPKNVGNGENI